MRTLGLALTLLLVACDGDSGTPDAAVGSDAGAPDAAAGVYRGTVGVGRTWIDVNVAGTAGCVSDYNPIPFTDGCVAWDDVIQGGCTYPATTIRVGLGAAGETTETCTLGCRLNALFSLPVGSTIPVTIEGAFGSASFDVVVPDLPASAITVATSDDGTTTHVTWSGGDAGDAAWVYASNSHDGFTCLGPDDGADDVADSSLSGAYYIVRVTRRRAVDSVTLANAAFEVYTEEHGNL
jgi:hypothetical protein